MKTIHKAVVSSSVAQYGKALIALASSMIVARLLTPEELGTFAIASAIVMVMGEFKMLGAGAYLVRETEIGEEKIRRALGLTVLISWGLGAAIYAGAPFVQSFYDIEGITTVFRILSVSFFVSPFVSIAVAQLHRKFDFSTTLRMQLFSAGVGLVTTVGLIYLGFSFYALAWGAASIILAELLTIVLLKHVDVYCVPRFDGILPIASFGVFNSTANLLKRLVNALPDMIIGKMGTAAQVGLFSRGLGMVIFLASTIQMGAAPVALPYLSSARRQGGDILQAYTLASQLLTSVIWPVLAVVAIASLPTLRFFFGLQWDVAAPIASWLALWLVLRTTHHLVNNLFIAAGHEKVMLLKEFLIFVVVLIAIPVGFEFGLVAVAKSFVCAGVVELILTTWLLRRVLGLSVLSFIKALLPSLVMSVACGVATYLISLIVDFESEQYWIPVLTIAIVLPFVWMGSAIVLRHPIVSEIRNVLGR